jgi:2-oxoglutarate dehydrogenase E1 component
VATDIFRTMNAGYAQLMYEQYRRDPTTVDEAWRALFENGVRGLEPLLETAREPPPSRAGPAPSGESVSPMRGAAARLVRNMEESLGVPTATSFREVAVAHLDTRRRQLNAALAPRKFSYTHLIGWAIVQAACDHRVMTHAFRVVDGTPHRVEPGEVNLGLAVDVEKKDGSRALVVPVIKGADRMDFASFHARYEELVELARSARLSPDDLAGATITLTNPGTLGTAFSVPRLMAGQGTIVATGTIREVAGDRIMTISSTYDHRVIQGAESGMFLRTVDRLLQGEDGFYESVFASLGAKPGSGEWGVGPVATATPATPALAAPRTHAAPQVAMAAPGPDVAELRHAAAAFALVRAHRVHGHRAARLDPLGSEPVGDPALDPGPLGLTPEVMARIPAEVLRVYLPEVRTLADVYPAMRETYCGTIAYEVEHIASHGERVWLRKVIESGAHRVRLTSAQRRALLSRLTQVETLETFLHRSYLGHKRFGIEGLDVLVPMIDLVIELAGEQGSRTVVLGMAHRGRLNVLAHVIGRPYETIFAEFEGGRNVEETLTPEGGTGDVKYHHGAQGVYRTSAGHAVNIVLSPNPSHLEAVNPVIEGWARALQTSRQAAGPGVHDGTVALPVLIHGDAAFAGQGSIAETFNLARLRGYATGGTIHLIANNQIGFTTDPRDARSTDYSSDLAKGFDVPIVHVNADDPEASLAAVRLAMMYRREFRGDVVIDVVGYRRHGHNEGDEPSYTQPVMYERIRATPPVRTRYLERLVAEGVTSEAESEAEAREAYRRCEEVQQALRASLALGAPVEEPHRIMRHAAPEPETAVPTQLLRVINEQLLAVPDGFSVNPKLRKQLERRREAPETGLDWAHAEALALASLLEEGVPIRLTGQDTERGTFSQRHLVFHDAECGRRWAPVQNLPGARASFELHNSPLSELACLGFEYGYAVAAPEALVLWEAQFGDFANGAEVIIDQFIIAGLAKWGQTSRLTMLLPHGYEGQGPEHSSARLERYLALGAEGNIRVANCTTPAQYFHLLRRQARHTELRPLILMTPKSLLRHPRATSRLDDLATGSFRPVLDDPDAKARADRITRLVLCSGKVYYDIVGSAQWASAETVAVGRVELLYPFPAPGIVALLSGYPNLRELVWAQEEPRNMGARKFVLPKLRELAPPSVALSDVSRPERSSPAEGYPAAHAMEQARIVREALGV